MTFKRQDIIDQLVRLRLKEGYSKHSLLEYVVDVYKKSKPYAYELIREAELEIKKFKLTEYKEDIDLEISRFEEIYQLAIKQKNLKVAKDALVEINKLKGLYIERQELKLSGEISVIKLKPVIKDEKDNTTNN